MNRTMKTPQLVGVLVAALVAAGLALALVGAPRGAAQEQGALLEYPAYPPTPTVGPNPTAGPQLAGAALLTSDFAAADALAAWEPVDLEFVLADMRANWLVADGRLVQDAAGRARSPTIHETAALAVLSVADSTVGVSFYDEYNGTAGLVARYQGADPTTASYYRFRMLKASFPATPKAVLEKVEGGVATALVAIDGPGFGERAWHTLELEAVGGRLTARLDGRVVAEASDAAPLPAGRAGVYTRASGGIFFDDFTITAP